MGNVATKVLVVRLIAWSVGGLVGLLCARLVARLLAGRAENSALALLYRITDPLIAPFTRLDRGQPQFGATLELSNLTLILIGSLLGFIIWRWCLHWSWKQK